MRPSCAFLRVLLVFNNVETPCAWIFFRWMAVIVITPSCAILPSEYTTIIMLITALHWSYVGPGRIARTFVLVCVCDSDLLFMFDAVGHAYETTSCNVTLMRHFISEYTTPRVQQMLITVVHQSSLVEYDGTGALPALDEQVVRLYCCVWVIEFDGVINWHWTQPHALCWKVLLLRISGK